MNQTFAQQADAVKPNGGNAVPGVSRINQENVSWTFQNFLDVLGPPLCIQRGLTSIIGSAGKKAPRETSGDIDIAIEIAYWHQLRFDIYDFYIDEIKKAGYAFKDMRQIGIISLAYPITNRDSNQFGQFVQIDLMLVDSLNYAKWGFYSPCYTQSEYKGLYRNELNFFIAKWADLYVTKVDEETETPTEWERYWFSTSAGLLHGKQTLISEKTGKIIKSPRVISKKLVSNDPDVVARFLYGDHVDSASILTFEDAVREFHSPRFPYKHNRSKIIADTIAGIEKKGYPVPDILSECISYKV